MLRFSSPYGQLSLVGEITPRKLEDKPNSTVKLYVFQTPYLLSVLKKKRMIITLFNSLKDCQLIRKA
jgi:hypothetical protein